jgi:iron complex transport system ATP-binding protein
VFKQKLMTKNKTILSTTNLTIGYKSKKETITIADNINLKLEAGKLIALIGANGVGKSTLLKTLTGIQKPLSGQVFLNEKSIETYNNSNLSQNLSMVLTEKLPPSNLTVHEIITLGRQPYTNWIGQLSEFDIEKITEAIQLTGVENYAHKKHDEISDGQLQKALIARAIAQDTNLIILDEPTTHLDLLHKVSVLKLLKKLSQDTSKCILFSTHDIDLAIQLSDEIIIIKEKNVIQDAPCNHILSGIFNSLFENESVLFDAEKGRFLFK